MPQMSPMNWMFLFILFNISMYTTFSKMNFLSKICVLNKKMTSKIKQSYNFLI